MKIQFFLLFACFFLSKYCLANDTLVVHKDPRLGTLTAKQALVNKHNSQLTSNGLFKGYRLQFINTSDRIAANKMKAELLNKFPNEKVYLSFQAPSFRVRMGNFINRIDAEDFANQLRKSFSSVIYVVEDAIEYTEKTDSEEPSNN